MTSNELGASVPHREPAPEAAARCRVVALGASAGGLDAFERFFRAVKPGLGFTFVVVQHLSPEHESILPQLLAAFTPLPVQPVIDGTSPLPDHVYVIPPNATLLFRDGRLRLRALEPRASRQPISALFSSLAAELGADAAAVVLSGTGSDGSTGLHVVRTQGGLTVVQSPSEAQYDSMPRSAVATGDVDYVLPAADMPALIARELKRRADHPRPAAAAGDGSDPLLSITEALRRQTGKEFGSFKRSTLQRRVQRRLTALGMTSLADYLARLQVDGAEATTLAGDLMIGVTRFFRDGPAFQALDSSALPQLFEFSGDQPVRVWVPGCATGEEAYTLAIQLLVHAQQRRGPAAGLPRVQVFATDINEAALATARLGRYPAAAAADVPPELLKRYFVPEEGGYAVAKEVRDSCIFSVHDVLRDPPFSRVDLISCRNLLIYFDAEVQARLLPVFHYALRPSGFLFLGSSETVGDLSSLFDVVDKKHRIFRRSNLAEPRVRLPLTLNAPERFPARPAPRGDPEGGASQELLRALLAGLLDERGTAVALVDARGLARYFAGPISRYLPTPAGAPTSNVLELATGDLRLEISAALQAAGAGGGQIRREIPLSPEAGGRRVELVVRALVLPAVAADHFLVIFRELEPAPGLAPGGAEQARTHELEGELRVATDRWRRAVQDLESANEELRSANEELQLSQEELQSVNEELNTVNAELASKVDEVNGLYADLQNLFQSTRIATVVVDRELAVTRFTPAAARLYPLTQADVGRPLANLSNPFSGEPVLAEARAVLEDLVPRERILQLDGGGGWHLLRALPYLSLGKSIEGVVLTFVDVTELKQAETALRLLQEREQERTAELEAIMRSVPAAVLITHHPSAASPVGNEAARRLLRVSPDQPLLLAGGGDAGARLRVVQGGRELAPGELPLERAAASGQEVRGFEGEVHFADGQHIHVLGQALPLLDGAGRPAGAVAAFMDVTNLKVVEGALRVAEGRLRGSLEAVLDAFAVFTPVRGPDGHPVDYAVAYLNGTARRLLGAEASGARRLRELLPASSPLPAVLDQALAQGSLVEQLDVPGPGEGGAERLHDLRACPLESGEVAIAWRDVTDRTRATQALREADRRKDEFLAVLGHELRNPLAALGMALALEERQSAGAGAQQKRHLEMMQRQLHALGRLVDDLLDVTRISRGKIHLESKPVDLAEVVRDELELYLPRPEDRRRLTFRAPAGPVWAMGDRDRIGQIAGNLLANALKFTAPGQAIEVAVELRGDGRPALRVRDHGIGMAPETVAHLFVPFWQADHSMDRARGGLGLGLSLVKGIAGLMGAEVEARSEGLGLGSEFTVCFRSAPPQPRPAPPPGLARSGRRRRILVIEDNQDVRQSVVELLEQDLGHEVVAADDGEAGVSRAREWLPELVLCDIGLPTLDGYEVARRLREEPALRGTVVAAMTGYGATADKERAGRAGFDRHFTKPIDLAELARFIEDLPQPPPGSDPGARPEA